MLLYMCCVSCPLGCHLNYYFVYFNHMLVRSLCEIFTWCQRFQKSSFFRVVALNVTHMENFGHNAKLLFREISCVQIFYCHILFLQFHITASPLGEDDILQIYLFLLSVCRISTSIWWPQSSPAQWSYTTGSLGESNASKLVISLWCLLRAKCTMWPQLGTTGPCLNGPRLYFVCLVYATLLLILMWCLKLTNSME